MKAIKIQNIKRERRHNRVRAKLFGTLERPRLSVFRSNSHFYAQLIDDASGKTIVASSDIKMKEAAKKSLKEKAKLVGADIAEKAKGKKVSKVIFDRGYFKYAGAVAELAESARKGGLSF